MSPMNGESKSEKKRHENRESGTNVESCRDHVKTTEVPSTLLLD